ncbi:hypothetical protein AWV79_17745 [Cupriavidus sp. UYMMa02A]|nr:hypothetical protein AWV79_17745 [Cupriavidus sp. UYMMa02A]
MVEIEIGVLRSRCLDPRIDCCDRLITEVVAWEQLRNASGAHINWVFSTETAREKWSKPTLYRTLTTVITSVQRY